MVSNTVSVPALIAPGTLYRLSEVKRRLGLGQVALRQMRRKGLHVRYLGRSGFILGRDLIRYIEIHGSETRPQGPAENTEAGE